MKFFPKNKKKVSARPDVNRGVNDSVHRVKPTVIKQS